MRKQPSNLVKSVDRSINILEELAKYEEGLGVTELGNRLDIHKSSVHRLLSTLVYKGLVEKDKKNNNYKLGLKIFELGSKIFNDFKISEYTKSYLKKLVKISGERVNLVIPDKDEIVYIDKREDSKNIKINLPIGHRSPMHCTAAGKAILANLSQDKIKDIIKSNLIKFTSNTITEVQDLINELDLIKARNYAIDDSEYKSEIRCVATPIFNYRDEVIAAISICGPKSRMTHEKISDLRETMVDIGREISCRLGYRANKNSVSLI
ncbi:IclR family transcriptional regulator [Halanaerocella petrolearia]